MHSSQNEQDSRYLADFAHVPCLEPATPQEVYQFTLDAFNLSEKMKLPVVLRLVTRLAHSRGVITRGEMKSPVALGFPQGDDKKNWVLIPAVARKQNLKLRAKLSEMLAVSAKYNHITMNGAKKGVLLAGMGRAYFNQLKRYHPELKNYNVMEVASYPVDKKQLKQFLAANSEVHVFEENYPYLEDQLLDLTRETKISGRRSGALTIDGELTPLSVKVALGMKGNESKGKASMPVAIRPPRLCDGCGHIDAFKALKEAQINIGNVDYRMFGDIGCYTLGFLPPFEGIQACVEMGASIGMAMGAAYVGMKPAVGIIGDSTFFHSGLPTLMSLVKSKDCNVTLVVMDNRITGMTGQQETVITDVIEKIAHAAGLPEANIHTLKPLPKFHAENVKILEKVLSHNGPDLIVFKRECVQAMRKGLYKKIDSEK
jgi:indolepyruvate ferredoxin oxidoreductase alpha subunit